MKIENLIKKLKFEMRVSDNKDEIELQYRMLYRTLKDLGLNDDYSIDYYEVCRINNIKIDLQYEIVNSGSFYSFRNSDYVECNIYLLDGPYVVFYAEIVANGKLGKITKELNIDWHSDYLDLSFKIGRLESVDVKNIVLEIDKFLKQFEEFKNTNIRYNIINDKVTTLDNINSIDSDYKYFDVEYCDN